MNSFINQRGYIFDKNKYKKSILNKIKKDLTITPENQKYTYNKIKYRFFIEDENYLRIPRYYGIKNYGKVKELFNPKSCNINFIGELKDNQKEIIKICINKIKKNNGGLLVVPCGEGKCLGKGTEIILFNGDIIKVENIKKGMLLMGDDNKERIVINTNKGYGKLYKISYHNNFYIVNKGHIMTIKTIDGIKDIEIEKVIKMKYYKGCRVKINFGNINIDNAYVMGKRYFYNKNINDIKIITNTTEQNRLDFIKGYESCSNNSIDDKITFIKNSIGYKTEMYYDIKIEEYGHGYYYGFYIEGNGRFLLKDFTVTHNTIMSIYISSILKKKTLIVVHKSFLEDQWMDRCKEFTNNNIGIIRQKKIEIKDKDIVIASIQTISKRNYLDDDIKDFGLVIFDECHRYSSKFFSLGLINYGAKYTLGLTATPYRKDGLFDVVKWNLGDIIYENLVRNNNKVIVKVIYYRSFDNDYFIEKIRNVGKKKIIDYVSMITNLIKIKSRNIIIIKIIKELMKDKNRKIILLSSRKKHIYFLKNVLDLIKPFNYNIGIYDGNISKKERKFNEDNSDLLLATYSMASEGLDIKRLNTVIISTPKRDIIQSIGRILRDKDTLIPPLIIDIADYLSIFNLQNNIRRKYYYLCKFIIEKFYFIDIKRVKEENFKKNDKEYIKSNFKDIININI